MEQTTHYELVILGGGPAGLSAGLYAARARLNHVLIERGAHGGQVLLTDWIDNYPGFPDGISGFDLIEKMSAQAKRFDLNSLMAEVLSVNLDDPKKKSLKLDNGQTITFDTLVICTGARANSLKVPGEEEMRGKGVSYCGTCDAPFYRNMEVAVVGGGNTAIQEAEYLTKFASKVTVIHRREELRATKVLQESALANEKLEFIWNSQVTAIEGENGVERIQLIDKDGNKSTLNAHGIFIFVGITPLNSCLPLEKLQADKWGFIPVDIETRTSVPGVMAAGDIISKDVRQVINAAGEGAVAVLAAEEYLNNLK
ncbi:thioredoxin-disulfide reductase [Desulfotalea psychrophila]|uniref:Thioredoxin reductase n=1 Tax=Desulfotalea psychrophila (strain LSv54 / DSM 12343) TaxID=177439 RepID=Q6AQ35_DESPS|nr:thioredoxin-disulfide reductase [Desulfotalea psychrophila]CAG35538.1 related to thioredoxin reductase [Desulfotalea psychrophila LSv54]